MDFIKITIVIVFAFTVVDQCAGQTRSAAIKNQTETLLQQISSAVENGDFLIAKKYLRQVFAREPNNVSAHTLAGIVASRSDDLTTAEKHFALAAKLQPNAAETRNNYGAILLKRGRTDQAIKEFEASLKANPNQPSAQINLAQIYFVKGTKANLRAAQKLFEKAFADSPEIEVARAMLVTALRLGETERAKKDFEQYAALMQNATLPASSRIELGLALLESNLFVEAKSELEVATELEPGNINAIVLLSRAYLGQKDIKSAGRILESAAARGIDKAEIYAALADVYQAGGYFENAIPAMRLAIERDPRNEQFRFRYGLLLIDTKAPAAAIVRLKEAVEEFPRSAQLWFGLGVAQFNDSKTGITKASDAQQSFQKALEIEPNLVPALAYLAAIDGESGNSMEAAAKYQRALARDDKSAALHYLLADTLLKNTALDTERIEKHLRRTIELDATIAAAHLALGRLYVRQKRFTEAAVELEKTVQLQPDRADAYYQLGQVYIRLKRADDSRQALAKFKTLTELEKTQSETDRREIVRRLANVKF